MKASRCHRPFRLPVSDVSQLNSTTTMIPLTWPEYGNLHPFAPIEQAQGYAEMMDVR